MRFSGKTCTKTGASLGAGRCILLGIGQLAVLLDMMNPVIGMSFALVAVVASVDDGCRIRLTCRGLQSP